LRESQRGWVSKLKRGFRVFAARSTAQIGIAGLMIAIVTTDHRICRRNINHLDRVRHGAEDL
jgi:hypothetical protein